MFSCLYPYIMNRLPSIDQNYLPPSQLRLPFSAKAKVAIEEGYFYSQQERKFHGLAKHFGVDFGALLGTEVYAARDGYILQSKHLDFVEQPSSQATIGYGLGNFAMELCFADNGNPFYVSYGHLDSVEESIPYYEPTWAADDSCDPVILYQSVESFMFQCRRVKMGDIIGRVGASGLAKAKGNKYSWDEPHLHFEAFFRKDPQFSKDPTLRFDPFGIYKTKHAYRGALKKALAPHDLWQRDQNGHCLYAAQ